MASFLAGPAAQLLGASLQAMGVGIPVSKDCSKVLEGMRGVGLPVPPKNWFKTKGGCSSGGNVVGDCLGGRCGMRGAASKEPKANVYDKLESHIQGVMQVVKPVMELKGVLASGCKSAERDRDRGRVFIPTSCERPKRSAQRQRSFSNDECYRSDLGCRSSPPLQKVLKKKQSVGKESKRGYPSETSDEEADDEVCMYCEKARCSMLRLPCGRTICGKCDKSEDHGLQCKQCKKLSS